MKNLLALVRRAPVLTAAAAAALVSMVLVPPSAAYAGYVDLRVLCLLFCLMAVVLGFRSCGLFDLLARRLLARCRRLRSLALVLVLLPFFSSMAVTNDVALITFVPFAALVLEMVGRSDLMIRVVVLQTAAANLGSMATPVGNPQNLYLCSAFSLSAGQFFAVLLPLTLASLVLILVLTAVMIPGGEARVDLGGGEAALRHPGRLALYGLLFLLCLLAVFRVLPYPAVTVVIAAAMAAADRRLLGRVDYALLLTFVCFFVFAGNMGALAPVRQLLEDMMGRSALFTSLAASQIISNVPAAVLLSGFTRDWRGLLVGTDVGGLGTLIASLASLISFQLYTARKDARPLRYLGVFTLVNLIGLAVLIPLALALG